MQKFIHEEIIWSGEHTLEKKLKQVKYCRPARNISHNKHTDSTEEDCVCVRTSKMEWERMYDWAYESEQLNWKGKKIKREWESTVEAPNASHVRGVLQDGQFSLTHICFFTCPECQSCEMLIINQIMSEK